MNQKTNGAGGEPRVDVIIGTRPDIIKLAPVVAAMVAGGIPHRVIHTGQHFDFNMSETFVQRFGMHVDEHLGVREVAYGRQMGALLDRVMEAVDSQIVLVQGDTNTALAAAMAGRRKRHLVGHVEAGLRCSEDIVEEMNRRMIGRLALAHFAPTRQAHLNLVREGVSGILAVTGNPVIDAVLSVDASRSDEGYVVATIHREDNTTREAYDRILGQLERIPRPVKLIVHPRARPLLRSTAVELIDPLGYDDFIRLLAGSHYAVTDSGGIQEEAVVLRKPVVVARDDTERPEGSGRVAFIAGQDFLAKALWLEECYDQVRRGVEATPWDLYGDGKAGERIAGLLKEALDASSDHWARVRRTPARQSLFINP